LSLARPVARPAPVAQAGEPVRDGCAAGVRPAAAGVHCPRPAAMASGSRVTAASWC